MLKIVVSRDGRSLIIVNGVPEYNITVWNLETLERLGEIELRTDLSFLTVCFSPKDSSLISVLYKECLQLCQMEPFFKFEKETPKDYNRFEVREYAQGGNLSMVWSETNLLYLSSLGKVQVIDPATLEEIASKKVLYISLINCRWSSS